MLTYNYTRHPLEGGSYKSKAFVTVLISVNDLYSILNRSILHTPGAVFLSLSNQHIPTMQNAGALSPQTRINRYVLIPLAYL